MGTTLLSPCAIKEKLSTSSRTQYPPHSREWVDPKSPSSTTRHGVLSDAALSRFNKLARSINSTYAAHLCLFPIIPIKECFESQAAISCSQGEVSKFEKQSCYLFITNPYICMNLSISPDTLNILGHECRSAGAIG